MDGFDYSEIGQRIKALRKRKGMSQTQLANLLNKSLRTVQKYETGEIEVSIGVVNTLAQLLDTTPTDILGYETNAAPIRNMADILSFLFEMDKVSSLKFDIDVKKPPRSKEWTCSISFNGKTPEADYNADICLFLEQWEEVRKDLRSYSIDPAYMRKWQSQTLAYYAGLSAECTEPEELDERERIARHTAYLEMQYGVKKGE